MKNLSDESEYAHKNHAGRTANVKNEIIESIHKNVFMCSTYYIYI